MKTSSRTLKTALVLLLAAAGPLAIAQAGGGMHGMHGASMHGGAGHAMGGGPGMMFGGMLSRALERINATPEQRTQIQQIMERARGEMRAQHDSGRALRDQALALFAQPTVDANAVEALRQQQLAQHDAASKRVSAAMLEVGRVLTLEQRRQLVEYVSQRREMMQRHQHERQRLDPPPKS